MGENNLKNYVWANVSEKVFEKTTKKTQGKTKKSNRKPRCSLYFHVVLLLLLCFPIIFQCSYIEAFLFSFLARVYGQDLDGEGWELPEAWEKLGEPLESKKSRRSDSFFCSLLHMHHTGKKEKRKFSTKKVSPLISRCSVAVAVSSLFFLPFSRSNPLRK